MEFGALIFHELRTTLVKYKKRIAFGDEGGYACYFESDTEALDILAETLERVHKKYGVYALIGLDIAATHFYDRTSKQYAWGGNMLMAEELVDVYEGLIKQYPICLIEDGLAEDEWDDWGYMAHRLSGKIQLIGDDIFVTRPERILYGIENNCASGSIIKPDQIGTITETLQTIRLCKEQEITTIISHRSGDTEDTFIADLAVGVSASQIKAGGFTRSERLAKYNRLLTIEDHLSLEL
jgi:enolase